MTKAILEFCLPEDKDDFTMAVRGSDYLRCLWDISQELRRLRKYKKLTKGQYKTIEDLEKFFYDSVGNLLEEVE